MDLISIKSQRTNEIMTLLSANSNGRGDEKKFARSKLLWMPESKRQFATAIKSHKFYTSTDCFSLFAKHIAQLFPYIEFNYISFVQRVESEAKGTKKFVFSWFLFVWLCALSISDFPIQPFFRRVPSGENESLWARFTTQTSNHQCRLMRFSWFLFWIDSLRTRT